VCNEFRIVLRIYDSALYNFLTSTAHGLLPFFLLLTLHTVLRTAAVTASDTEGVKLTANDVITHTRKVLYTTTANQHNAVFLQVVAFARNICRNFVARSKAHTGNLTESRVRLLGSHRLNDETNAAALRARLKRRRLRMLCEGLTTLAD
jgi:hypothetical protein